MQPLHPQAVEKASLDPSFTNTETPRLKSTENQQNIKPFTRITRTKIYSKSIPIESSQTIKGWIFALKYFIKYGLNDIRGTIEKVSQKFDQIFYREYTKNLWDEIASKNTIFSLIR